MNPTLSDKTISELALDVLDMEGSELATIDGHYWLILGSKSTFIELSDRVYHAIIFSRFIKVQVKGNYNMFTEGGSAAKDANLSLEEYTYVLQNYKELDYFFQLAGSLRHSWSSSTSSCLI